MCNLSTEEVLKIVEDFAKFHPICNYCIIADNIANANIRCVNDEEFRRETGVDQEYEGVGSYISACKTIYIKAPYEHEEYTLLRTLTHEYGHYLQDVALNANSTNCLLPILELHNIMFNENINNNDRPNNSPYKVTIDSDTGYRVSYSPMTKKELFDQTLINYAKQLFETDIYTFILRMDYIIRSVCEDKDEIKKMRNKNTLLLTDIYYYISELNDGYNRDSDYIGYKYLAIALFSNIITSLCGSKHKMQDLYRQLSL